MRRAASIAAALVTTSICCFALAQAHDSNEDAGLLASRATRRSDLTVGLGAGLVAGRALGYPNEIGKIDKPAYEANTSGTFGSGAELWLGVAFNDWLTFALGGSTIDLQADDLSAAGRSFVFRVEAFPFFSLGGIGRDLGLAARFGIASLKIKAEDTEVAEGGSMSLVGVGAFYEALRLGRFTLGPTLEYTHLFSLSAELDSGLLGARVAFYGGPSRAYGAEHP